MHDKDGHKPLFLELLDLSIALATAVFGALPIIPLFQAAGKVHAFCVDMMMSNKCRAKRPSISW